MTSFYVSAAHKSSGKTSVSIGLAGAMVKRGQSVQTFKRGPDYIDPIWLSAASGKPCYNLDFNTQSPSEIDRLFALKSKGADISFVEGSKGLYDGVDVGGADSNAALASQLSLPVLLVIDCKGMTRGIAPLLLGYQAFDEAINIAGVILNKTGSTRHQGKLRQAVENYTDIPVLGMISKSSAMEIPERHLGLTPANEMESAAKVIENMTRTVEEGVDLDAVMALGQKGSGGEAFDRAAQQLDVTIAIARDAAFGFYYPDDLEAFILAGAKLVFFDVLNDAELPACDGLFIGGGFPETHLAKLTQNKSMRASIRSALEAGLPCYAECGGLMYLSRSISYQGQTAEMVGTIPGAITMSDRPQGRGLVKLQATVLSPWPFVAKSDGLLPAHEFHYAKLEGLPKGMRYAYDVKRGYGIDGDHDGLLIGNCLASFTHLRNSSRTPWVTAFVDFVRKHSR